MKLNFYFRYSLNFLKLQKTFKDAIIASDYLGNNEIELNFLDIHLPKLKGISFLKTLEKQPAVIITTAYHQYAIEGFNLNVTDYILKPFEFERFLAAVNKVKASLNNKKVIYENQETKDFIFLNVQKKKMKILFSDHDKADGHWEETELIQLVSSCDCQLL